MPKTEPRSELVYDWSIGETGWGDDMNANLARIGRFGFHLTVIDRDLTEPPETPTHGDAYIVGAGATGDWDGHDDDVAIYDTGDWVFGTPRGGWTAVVLDEKKVVGYFEGEGWSTGVELDPT